MVHMLNRVCQLALLVIIASLWPAGVQSASGQDAASNKHALLIGGLGGSPDHTQKFKEYLFETRKALINQYQIPAANIVVLGEKNIEAEDFVTAISTSENIRAQFESLKSKVGASDHVYIILFGHGSYADGEARLNIPRRDLSQQDYANLTNELAAGRIVFINTSSASAPFIEALSASNRIVITATRTGTQKNETSFPRFLVEALTSPATDRDKDGRVSVGELYSFAAEKTDQMFADNANIATEDALIDDNGDQKGSRLGELESGVDGNLASITYLAETGPAIASGAPAGGQGSAAWLQERGEIEVEIANLKSAKGNLATDDYYAQLEELFVRLARGNAEAEGGE